MPDDEQCHVKYWRTKRIKGRQLLKMQQTTAAAHIQHFGHSGLDAGMLPLGLRNYKCKLYQDQACRLCLRGLIAPTNHHYDIVAIS